MILTVITSRPVRLPKVLGLSGRGGLMFRHRFGNHLARSDFRGHFRRQFLLQFRRQF